MEYFYCAILEAGNLGLSLDGSISTVALSDNNGMSLIVKVRDIIFANLYLLPRSLCEIVGNPSKQFGIAILQLFGGFMGYSLKSHLPHTTPAKMRML